MGWPPHLENNRFRRCRDCDVTWVGGPTCWCCGRHVLAFGETATQA